jgi:hypothetical protein
MAKQSGLGDNLLVGGYDLSGDVGAVGNVGGGVAGTQDMTGINKSAFERVGLARDGRLEYTAFFNPAGAHPVLSALPTADQVATYCRGTTLGDPGACMVGKQINYDPTRGQDGSLTIAVQTLANGYGLEWGRQLTAGLRTDTAATNGSSVDFGTGSTAFGLQAYLQVTAFTGTSVTVTLQESSDNGSVDPWAAVTGGAFTAATGITTQRIATSATQTVERYLRVVTTGVFTSATFNVVVVRNTTAVSF